MIFFPHKSCMTQLLIAMDEWTEALDRGDSLDVLYLNFKKAFILYLMKGYLAKKVHTKDEKLFKRSQIKSVCK